MEHTRFKSTAKHLFSSGAHRALVVWVIFKAWPAFGNESHLTLNEVKTELAKHPEINWQAGPSPFFHDDGFDRQVLAGAEDGDLALPTLFSKLERREHGTGGNAHPRHFDWREVSGTDWLNPDVHEQGECGSCVAFAMLSAVEARLNIACGTPEQSFDLSRQYLFSCGGGHCKQGWKLSSAVAFLVENGVPDSHCFPYSSLDGSDLECRLACSDADERLVKGVSFQTPTVGWTDIEAIKTALLDGPLLANLILYEDLEYYRDGVYQHLTGRKLGSHAITLVGWNDETRSWIARNSWGTDWGQRGYFHIAWDDTSLPGRYTWAFDVSEAVSRGICSLPR